MTNPSFSGKEVTFETNGSKTSAYLSLPTSPNGLAVIVLQEWWGLVDHIKDVTDRFAREGFVALSPDLYHGESTKKPDDAGRLMMALNIEKTEVDLQSAVKFLIEKHGIKQKGIGVIGFCMGGQLALYAGSQNKDIGGIIDFYGVHPEVKVPFSDIKVPVLGFFGDHDEYVTKDVVAKLDDDLKGVEHTFYSYDANHAFFNDTREEVYDKKSAQDAWEKSLEFFKSHLIS